MINVDARPFDMKHTAVFREYSARVVGTRRIFLSACVAVAFVGACDSFQPKLDMRKIRIAIAQTATNEFPKTTVDVATCPAARIERNDDRFVCTVSVDEQQVRYEVAQTNGHGRVALRRQDAFALAPTVANQGRDLLRRRGIVVRTFTCDDHRVYFPRVTQRVRCQAAVATVDHLIYVATLDRNGMVASVAAGGI